MAGMFDACFSGNGVLLEGNHTLNLRTTHFVFASLVAKHGQFQLECEMGTTVRAHICQTNPRITVSYYAEPIGFILQPASTITMPFDVYTIKGDAEILAAVDKLQKNCPNVSFRFPIIVPIYLYLKPEANFSRGFFNRWVGARRVEVPADKVEIIERMTLSKRATPLQIMEEAVAMSSKVEKIKQAAVKAFLKAKQR